MSAPTLDSLVLSTPLVRVEESTGSSSKERVGTGIVVGPSLVLTALHLVDAQWATATREKLSQAAIKIRIEFQTADGRKRYVAEVAWEYFGLANAKEDWVILRFTPEPGHDPPTVRPGSIASCYQNSRWESFGYVEGFPEGLGLSGELLPTYVQQSPIRYQVRCFNTGGGGASLQGLSGGPCQVADKVVGMFVDELSREGQTLLNTAYVLPLAVICKHHPQLFPGQPLREPPRLTGLLPLFRKTAETSFRRYLQSEHLPYYSRKQHLQANRDHADRGIEDEDQLLDRLEQGEDSGVILSGAGGAGKSRLLVELGVRAAARGHVVCRVSDVVPQSSLESLAQALPAGTTALLLIDYIETQPDFASLVRMIDGLSEQGHTVRYAACCRASFYDAMSGQFRPHHLVRVSTSDDSIEGKWLRAYQAATVQHILQQIKKEDREQVEALCGSQPVFAVLALWLQARSLLRPPLQGEGPELSISLQQLLNEKDFVQYVQRRMEASRLRGHATRGSVPLADVRRDVAQLLALLPFPCARQERWGGPAQLFDILAIDGLIERESLLGNASDDEPALEDHWCSVHDILVDQILLSELAASPATRESQVRQLLDQAAVLGSVPSALTSLDRLANRDELRSMPYKALLLHAVQTRPDAWPREARLQLFRSPLLLTDERLALLVEPSTASLFVGCELEAAFHRSLGWIIEQAQESRAGLLPEQRARLLDWVQRCLPQVADDNYLLSKALPLRDETVTTAAQQWLTRHPAELQTHYLLCQWLLTDLPKEPIAAIVAAWLVQFRLAHKWSFLSRAWLEAGGTPDAVRAPLPAWLRRHGEQEVAKFVYKAWLDAGGEPAAVREKLLAWVQIHGKQEAAQFVYTAWLDATRNPAAIRERLLSWVEIHGKQEDAKWVYKAWLNAGGNPTDLRDNLLAWVEIHGKQEDAQFVYKAWLDATKNPPAVRETLLDWVEIHGAQEVAGFVYTAWLNAGGNPADLRDNLLTWVQLHGKQEDAQFVYTAWLDATKNPAAVQETLFDWVQIHGEKKSADFVYKAWLGAGQPLQPIRAAVARWFHLYRRTQGAKFVGKYLGMSPDLSDETVGDILDWCCCFAGDEDAIWRLSRLGSYLQRETVAEAVLTACEAVFPPLFARGRLSAELQRNVESITHNLRQNDALLDSARKQRTLPLLASWLRHPSSCLYPVDKQPYVQKPRFLSLVLELLIRGHLEVARDRTHLERMIAWLNTWEKHNRTRLAPIVQRLCKQFPATAPLWQRIRLLP